MMKQQSYTSPYLTTKNHSILLQTPVYREDSNNPNFKSPFQQLKTPLQNQDIFMDNNSNTNSLRLTPRIDILSPNYGMDIPAFNYSLGNHCTVLQSHLNHFEITPRNKTQVLKPIQKTTSYHQKLEFSPLVRTAEKQYHTEEFSKNQKSFEHYGIPLKFQQESQDEQNQQQTICKKIKSKRSCEKGLKNLSITVAEIVKAYDRITYKQVANKLINQYIKQGKIPPSHNNRDIQNAKRRVYDALNVLLAANVLIKQGKLLSQCVKKPKRFLTVNQQVVKEKLKQQIQLKKKSLLQKDHNLIQLYNKYTAAVNLQNRNRKQKTNSQIIRFPFVFLRYPADGDLNVVKVSEQNTQISLDKPFQMWGDIDMALKLNLHKNKIKGLVDKQVQEYLNSQQKFRVE